MGKVKKGKSRENGDKTFACDKINSFEDDFGIFQSTQTKPSHEQ